jgi:HAD superfamily hydrolase (TIGR01509 family)
MYKQYFVDKKAVFFDLDGTMIDSERIWKDAVNTVLKELGCPEQEFTLHNRLLDFYQMLVDDKTLKTTLKIKELEKKTEETFIKLAKIRNLDLKNGFVDMLYALKVKKGFKVALITNSAREVGEKILQRFGMEMSFDLILGGDEVKNKKPSPEIYNLALKKLNLKPTDVIVFEDTVTGSKASVAARLETIVIWDGAVSEKEYPEEVILFSEDFVPLVQNLDVDYEDILKVNRERLNQEQPQQI